MRTVNPALIPRNHRIEELIEAAVEDGDGVRRSRDDLRLGMSVEIDSSAIAAGIGLKIGDSLTVNVLGRNITAKIANFRTVEWESLSMNFVMIFSPNTFAGAPHAWLATLSDAEALSLVERQDVAIAEGLGPNAPRSNIELLERLRLAREQGYAWVEESSAVGTSAIAAVVRHPLDRRVVGVLSVAGPSARLPQARLHELAPLLLSFAEELSAASQASELFS